MPDQTQTSTCITWIDFEPLEFVGQVGTYYIRVPLRDQEYSLATLHYIPL